MTLDEYNQAAKHLFAEQQEIAQSTAKLALSGLGNPTNPQFGALMAKQWSLIQDMAKLNTEMMVGIMKPRL